MAEAPLTRREITRQRTLEEIRGHAEKQVREGGPEAVSLNAIAKSMGMSGPAIYRYFSSRDELILDLVDAGYQELTVSIGEAIGAVGDEGPEAQLRALARAYYAWAIGNPHRFAMFYPVRTATPVELDHTISTAQQSMNVLLMLLSQIESGSKAKGSGRKRSTTELDHQLKHWMKVRRVTGDYSALVLKLGVLAWTRLHGITTLELAGVFQDMNVDAALLCDAEIESIIEQVQAG